MKYIQLPLSIFSALALLDDSTLALLMQSIHTYCTTGEQPSLTLSPVATLLWTQIRSELDQQILHTQRISQARSLAGKQGGRPAKRSTPQASTAGKASTPSAASTAPSASTAPVPAASPAGTIPGSSSAPAPAASAAGSSAPVPAASSAGSPAPVPAASAAGISPTGATLPDIPNTPLPYSTFLLWQQSYTPYTFRNIPHLSPEEYDKLLSRFTPSRLHETLLNLENRKDKRKQYSSLYRTMLNWCRPLPSSSPPAGTGREQVSTKHFELF